MSKLARVLALGALLTAVNLASLTAVAHATDDTAATQDGQRPPTERQVGEAWRHRGVTADQSPVAGNPQRPPLERQVGEYYRHHVTAARPAEPSGQPGWLIPAIGVLAALALCGGLAVTTTRRAHRRVRARPAA
jgi:hypothetical protein